MLKGFKLLNIRGIEIRMDWTLFLLGTIISFSLATGYLPTVLPGWGAGIYITGALLGAFGLIASVLAHELAHAFTARKYGYQVETIHLNLFGGVASLKEEPRNPRHEFWITVVGPLSSLGLSGLFLGISFATAAASPAVAALGGYLGVINFILFAFNLIPAYPMDGGRILRALLWKTTGDHLKATRWASISGRVIGWSMVGVGFLAILSGFFFSGLWLALIGWIIAMAARAGYLQALADVSLQGLTTGQVAWRGSPHLHPQMTLSQAMPFFLQTERGKLLPVVEENYLVGVISPEEMRRYRPAEWPQLTIGAVMQWRGSLLAFKPEDDLKHSLDKMTAKPTLYAAVIGEGGGYYGMLYLADIPRFLQMQQSLGLVSPDGRRQFGPELLNRPDEAERPVVNNLDKVA